MTTVSIKNTIISSVLLLCTLALRGQQEANLILYRFHMNVFNPAVVGVDGESWINATMRRQWANIEYAPETQAVSLGFPVGNKLGLGLSVINDQTFIESQTGTFIDFSYRLQFGTKSELYLGLKAGGRQYNLNTIGLETYNFEMDPSLESLNAFNPNIGAGAYLKGNKYYLSLSVPHLLTADEATSNGELATVSNSRAHVYLSSGYDFYLTDAFTFSPSFLLRYVNGSPLSMDITPTVSYQNSMSLGVSYRTDTAISGFFSLRVSKRMTVTYAFENSLRNELQQSAVNTHEFAVRFLLGTKQ
jgi:type IX secretion system PorP/SprF family membrane protein